MDVRDIMASGEDSLPKLSTATMSAENTGFHVPITQSGFVKFGVSGLMSILGMYYLAVGKKEGDLQKMLVGGALSLCALFFF